MRKPTRQFCPTLCAARVSARYINPRDTVFVTLRWQANAPAPCDIVFALCADFGHQRRLENRADVFIAQACAFPCPTRWREGETVSVTVPWRCIADWSGTFHLSIRMLDAQGCPIAFVGEDGTNMLHQYIGDVDVSWNLGRTWVAEHSAPYEVSFSLPRPMPPVPPAPGSCRIGDALAVELAAEAPTLLSLRIEGRAYPLRDASPMARLRHVQSGTRMTEGQAGLSVVYAYDTGDANAAAYRCEAFVHGALIASCRILLTVTHRALHIHDAYIPGGRFIPLVQMIYHGIIGYASPSETREQTLWGLLMGAHTFHEEDITGRLSISRYYVQNLPAMLMDELPMTDFRWEGTTARAEFGAESWVEVDFAGQRYRVIYEGTMIGKDFTTFAPGPKGYLTYTMDKSLSGYKGNNVMEFTTPTVVSDGTDGNYKLMKSLTNAQGDKITVTADANNQIQSVTDGAGRTTTFVYDAGGRLKEVFAPDMQEQSVRFYYDVAGQLIRILHEDETEALYAYDAQGRLVEIDNFNS